MAAVLVIVGTGSEGFGQAEFRKPTWRGLNQSEPDSVSRHRTTPGNFGLAAHRRPTVPEAIVTRQTSFGVPFSIRPEAGPIREVQLHVSRDSGKSWDLYSRQLPTASEFPFRASSDGVYWFAVKTVGTQLSSQDLAPELVISIDSIKPTLAVDIRTDAQGKLVVHWRATDENLDPASIRLAYQSVSNWGRSGGWKDVQLPRVDASIESVFDDTISFDAQTSNVSLDLRISISDKAGNVTVLNRRFNLPRAALRRSNGSQPVIARRVGDLEGDRKGNGSGSRPPAVDPFAQVTQATKDEAARKVGIHSSFQAGLTSEGVTAGGQIHSSEDRPEGWSVVGGSGFGQDFRNNRPLESELVQNVGEVVPGSVSDPGFRSPARMASSSRSVDDVRSDFQRGSNINRIPDGQYAKLSSSRKFELDYLVEHIQPDDISRLEIWVTEDAGQSWRLDSVDQDRQSPVEMKVDDDGVYGYRIRIQTNDGLESLQPARGDSADVWVEVDTTRPSVELVSIPYGRRTDAGKLIINWRATDRRLAAKPITIYYAVALDGPWEVVVEKLENSGQFKWPVTRRIPRKVYIRIECVDAAGNRNFHQTDQMIDLSGLNPRGMIRGVRPLDVRPGTQ